MTLAQHARIAPVAAIVAALAVTGMVLRPDQAMAWSVGAGAMAAAWAVTALAARKQQSDSQQRLLIQSAIMAGLLLAVAMAAKLAEELGYDGGAGRAFGVAQGLVLVAMGNMLPKMIGPLTASRCAPAARQSIQRFAGWAFALSGLIYTGSWLALDIPAAGTISTMACASAVVLIIARVLWATTRPSLT